MSDKPIYVTQPSLPPLADFYPLLEQIWSTRTLTNCGPLHSRLESELCKYLGVPYLSLFNNGTNALLTAIQSLGLSGEIITTPYSFVATANSIVWNGIKPVFVDIDPKTLNICPQSIERAITDKTTAIMPVQCYGNPCAEKEIRVIAEKYNLKVIYDSAHAFGVFDTNGSILNHGDLAVLSFHATKVFNTFEGGAIVCRDEGTKIKIDQLKNFGIVDELTVEHVGINGKMSEVNAAFGLIQLTHVESNIIKRGVIDAAYRVQLNDIDGISVPYTSPEVKRNFSYFPILVTEQFPLSRDELFELLKSHGIFARRYFYPLISDFAAFRTSDASVVHDIPNAKLIAQQVLCLPIFSDMQVDDVARVVSVLVSAKERSK